MTDLGRLHECYSQLGLKPQQFSMCISEEGFTPPWRIVGIDRGWCSAIGLDEGGQESLQRIRTGNWLMVVGDWAVLSDPSEGPGVRQVLERVTYLRRATRGVEAQQWIAANLDTVFVVAAFGPTDKLERRGINARRIERYLSAVQEGGATPVVVLNKQDVTGRDAEQHQALCTELESRFGVSVVSVSAVEDPRLIPLQPYLRVGVTVAFVGPSGVGKSTLINALSGRDEAATSHVRASDMKGRHTTTRRELLRVPGGALLIDTPGMREFAVCLEDEVVPGFNDIEEMAMQCRFSNCQHDSEPGCAVMAAIREGGLQRDRLNSYRAIVRDGHRAWKQKRPKVPSPAAKSRQAVWAYGQRSQGTQATLSTCVQVRESNAIAGKFR